MTPIDQIPDRFSDGLVNYAQIYDEDFFQAYQPGSSSHEKRLKMYPLEYSRISQYIQAGAVLDVGCGLGDFLQLFPTEHWQRYGIEVAPYAAEIAKTRGILMDLPSNPVGFFDLVIFRGTLQHLDEPLVTIKRCIKWLRPGGYMVFLATPNIGSLCYRLFQELPALNPDHNFMLVSDSILRQILQNFGMEVLRFEFPYLGTPYANPLRDLWCFIGRCFGIRSRFAFWGNMLECYARKPAVPRAHN